MSTICSYDEAPVEHKPYRQKDGAMLAVGALCDKLKQKDPYKSELERMLVQHIFPEFSSPVGHLRAKVFLALSCVVDISVIHCYQLTGVGILFCLHFHEVCYPSIYSRTLSTIA